MSNLPPDDDYLDDTDENTPHRAGSTRPMNPESTGRAPRRPIPADDVPPVYSRPSLSRRQIGQPQPPQDHIARPTAQLPPESQYYPPQEPVAARQTRGNRNRPRSERPAMPPRDKARSGLYLPWWSLLIMLAFVGCAAIGALAVVSTLDNNTQAGGQTPVIIVITSTYTVGPPASPTPIPQRPTLTPSPPLPTIPPTLTLPPGNFAIGETITVVGVGESGLNIRSAPGTDSSIKFRARDGESYILKDGPQQASGDEWWFIQDSVDQNKSGWASRRYLSIQGSAPPVAAP